MEDGGEPAVNYTKKKDPAARGIPQPFKRQAGPAPHFKPVVAQLMTAVSAQSVKRPIAPPVYKPQLQPTVAQPKTAVAPAKSGVSAQRVMHRVAPPAYRPQPAPKAAQPKKVWKPPMAAPVYRPQPVPKVLQTKNSLGHGAQAGQAERQVVAPPAYRPEAMKLIQPNAMLQLRKSPTAPPVYRPEQKRIAQPKMASAAPAHLQQLQGRELIQIAQQRIGRARNSPGGGIAAVRRQARGVDSEKTGLRDVTRRNNSPASVQRTNPTTPRTKQLASGGGDSRPTVVQAMLSWFGKKPNKEKEEGRSTYNNGTIKAKLEMLGHTLEWVAGKYQIMGTNISIDGLLLKQPSPEVFAMILQLLYGGDFVVYRAVSRYHPRFREALEGIAQPLGSGNASFDTGSAAWTAWQWNEGMAEAVAASSTGMGIHDRIEIQPGYTLDDDFEVGVILVTTVTPDTEICFFNATEVQLKDRIQAKVHRVTRMGTRLENIGALSHYATESKTKVSHLMPKPTREQSDELWYGNQHRVMVGHNVIGSGETVRPAHDYSSEYIG